MMEKIGRAADDYIADKRGTKHENDEDWRPFWDMGKKRFESAMILSDFAKDYKKKFAITSDTPFAKEIKRFVGDRKIERNYETMTSDMLNEKEWITMMEDVDDLDRKITKNMSDTRKKRIEDHKKQDAQTIREAAIGLLCAKAVKVELKREDSTLYDEDHARLVFDTSANKIANDPRFNLIMEKMPGTTEFEKVMNLKKIAMHDNGELLLKNFVKAKGKTADNFDLELPKSKKTVQPKTVEITEEKKTATKVIKHK